MCVCAAVLARDTRKKRQIAAVLRRVGIPTKTRDITAVERWAVGGWDTVHHRIYIEALEKGRQSRTTAACTGCALRVVNRNSLIVADAAKYYSRAQLRRWGCGLAVNNHRRKQHVVPNLKTQSGGSVSTQGIESRWHSVRNHMRKCGVHGKPLEKKQMQLYLDEYCWWVNEGLLPFKNDDAPAKLIPLLRFSSGEEAA